MLSNSVILLADGNQEARSRVKNFLEEEGAAILEAYDGACALEIFQEKQNKIDLIIIDVILPVYDGWTVCREIRKHSMIPIMILTSRDAEFDEIHGLEIGADDYIRKAVHREVLSARIKALLRRTKPQDSTAYYFGGLTIEPASHKVNVNRQEINLSPKEYQILITLAQNQGRIISREELFHKVWGCHYYAGLRTVDTHINRLREKLCESGGYIHTIRGFGYRFDGNQEK
ncbi:MAG: response regulator transcription factor [Lachnospiraceae bacterium]